MLLHIESSFSLILPQTEEMVHHEVHIAKSFHQTQNANGYEVRALALYDNKIKTLQQRKGNT